MEATLKAWFVGTTLHWELRRVYACLVHGETDGCSEAVGGEPLHRWLRRQGPGLERVMSLLGEKWSRVWVPSHRATLHLPQRAGPVEVLDSDEEHSVRHQEHALTNVGLVLFLLLLPEVMRKVHQRGRAWSLLEALCSKLLPSSFVCSSFCEPEQEVMALCGAGGEACKHLEEVQGRCCCEAEAPQLRVVRGMQSALGLTHCPAVLAALKE